MKPIENVSVREKAYIILRDAIIDGTMKPGERLVEDALSAKFNVSRTPLREAIHKLELDGFLVRLPSRGLMVSELSVKEVTELYEIRSYLEGLATRLTTENLVVEQAQFLVSIKQSAEYYKSIGSTKLANATCNEVHNFVRTNCNHKVCIDYINKMRIHIARYGRISVSQEGRSEQAFQEHINIINNILSGDGEGAEKAMRVHILNSCNAVINSIKEKLS